MKFFQKHCSIFTNPLKKITSLFLVLLLSITSFPTTTFATPVNFTARELYGNYTSIYAAIKDNVPVRSEPSGKADEIYTLAYREPVENLGVYTTLQSDYYWIRVATRNNTTGWVCMKNVAEHTHCITNYLVYHICTECYSVWKEEGSDDTISLNESNAEIHLMLASLSLIPVAGNAFDLADAILCISEGDFGNAILNLVATIPALGSAFDELKIGNQVVEFLDETNDVTVTVSHIADNITEEGIEKTFSASLKPDSRVLGQNMDLKYAETGEAIYKRKAEGAAHHIVEGSAPEAAESRKILEEVKIDINSADNGVFLCHTQACVEEFGTAIHNGRHTKDYSKAVYTRLKDALDTAGSDFASRRKAVKDALAEIANDLHNNDLKTQKW